MEVLDGWCGTTTTTTTTTTVGCSRCCPAGCADNHSNNNSNNNGCGNRGLCFLARGDGGGEDCGDRDGLLQLVQRRRRQRRRRSRQQISTAVSHDNDDDVDDIADGDDGPIEYVRDGLLRLTEIDASVESVDSNWPDPNGTEIADHNENHQPRRHPQSTTVDVEPLPGDEESPSGSDLPLIVEREMTSISTTPTREPSMSVHDTTTTPHPFVSFYGRNEWIVRRYLLVLGCALVVLVVDDLTVLMSLFGAVGQTGLAMMPCAIHLKLQQEGIAPRNVVMSFVDILTIAFSFCVMSTGGIFSLQAIIVVGKGNGDCV
jgi:hypothetical protein